MLSHYDSIKSEYLKNKQKKVADFGKDFTKLRNRLLCYVDNTAWAKELDEILIVFEDEFNSSKTEQCNVLKELAYLYIDLSSAYTMWYLETAINDTVIKDGKTKIERLLEKMQAAAPDAQTIFIEKAISRTIKRYDAEKIKPEIQESQAKKDCGKTVLEYCKNMIEKINNSNLAKIVRLAKNSSSQSIIGNDFADFLQETLWLGVSFVTTNPPLIDAAWDLESAHWKNSLKSFWEKEQAILKELPSWMTKPEKLYTCVTMLIVEKNCKMLRDIFLLTNGSTGYCCYQVNPINHQDTKKMLDEVLFVHAALQRRLGEVPNVSFKLPGLPSSLKVAEALAEKGISVSITLEYGLFQAVEFAKIFKTSTALLNNLVIMNGRIAFPVRDELIQSGISVEDQSYRFTGVEITRRLYQILYSKKTEGGMGLDSKKIRIMNASLRNYGDDIPDLTELWGSPLITIFPNAREVFDRAKREITLKAIFRKTSKSVLDTLKKSKQFCQAYWYEGDGTETKPEHYIPFDLEHEKAIINWPPVNATLNQFLDSYKALSLKADKIISEV